MIFRISAIDPCLPGHLEFAEEYAARRYFVRVIPTPKAHRVIALEGISQPGECGRLTRAGVATPPWRQAAQPLLLVTGQPIPTLAFVQIRLLEPQPQRFTRHAEIFGNLDVRFPRWYEPAEWPLHETPADTAGRVATLSS